MPAKYQTRIYKARFVYSPFTGQQMAAFGDELREQIWDRIASGYNVYGAPAKPLAESYAKYKRRRYGSDLRNLVATGRLRRSVKVLQANQNRAYIGPTEGYHTVQKRFSSGRIRSAVTFADVLRINNRRERQWGVSRDELAHIGRVIAGERPIRAKQVA